MAQVVIQAAQFAAENAGQIHRGASGHYMQVSACTVAVSSCAQQSVQDARQGGAAGVPDHICNATFLRTLKPPKGFGAGLGQAHGGCGVWRGDGDVREDLVARQGGRPVPAARAPESRRHGGDRLPA